MNNNPETYLLSHNRIIDYLVLIFVDKKKAQIYTFPNRVDEHDIIKLIIDFQYKRLFRPNKHLERYHIGTPKHENFLFKIGDKKYLHVGESIFTFTTNSNINKYGFKYGYNDIKFPFAYDQTNIYYMLEKNMNLSINLKNLHTKTNILTCIEMIKQTVKNYKIINLFMNNIT